jgi:cytochrome P450
VLALTSIVVKHLGEEQAVQEKLRNGLLQAYPEALAKGQDPVLQDIVKANVPYLDAFIQEVLRVSHPVAFIGKETLCDMNILGHPIRKGTTILLTSAGPTFTEPGVQVDESIRSESSQKHLEVPGDWGNSEFPPDKFLPDRWLQAAPETRDVAFNGKAGPFMSFSSGPRMCWGKRLAYLELKLITTLLLWNFAFEKLPPKLHDWKCLDHLFMKPKQCYVKFSTIRDPAKG